LTWGEYSSLHFWGYAVILQRLEANAVGSARKQKMSVPCVTAQDCIPVWNQQKPLKNCGLL
jgi:hypothetical protein